MRMRGEHEDGKGACRSFAGIDQRCKGLEERKRQPGLMIGMLLLRASAGIFRGRRQL